MRYLIDFFKFDVQIRDLELDNKRAKLMKVYIKSNKFLKIIGISLLYRRGTKDNDAMSNISSIKVIYFLENLKFDQMNEVVGLW